MRIINIIDRFDKVNFGIWNAAIATAKMLNETYGVQSELWFPETDFEAETPGANQIMLNFKTDSVASIFAKRQLNPATDIIVTHGCWQYPTRWGAAFKKLGFKWICVPHGMLEPWSMQQKFIKKQLYFLLFEGRLSRKANVVRAVGSPELLNLKKLFASIVLIPNGINIDSTTSISKPSNPVQYLFMARLHRKKGVVQLVKAWQNSCLKNSPEHRLVIAGPDDGELSDLMPVIASATNVSYVGAVYGTEKQKLLRESHFYVLPSHSEGFPTSVVEALGNGLVPIISNGCNFPEAFENKVAIHTETNESAILKSLNESSKISEPELKVLSAKCIAFVLENYSTSRIAALQFQLYNGLLCN